MMNKNILSLTGILTLFVFAFSLASASVSISNVEFPSSVHEDDGSFTFTFDVTYSGVSNNANITFTTTQSFGTVTIPTIVSIDGTTSQKKSVTGTVSGFSNKGGNDLNITFNATATTGEFDIESFKTKINDNLVLCPLGQKGTLEISDFSIENLGAGSDDEWEPLDSLEIEVEIENTDKDDDVLDVLVELYIVDENGDDITSEFEISDEEVDLGRINEDDTEIALFEIEEVPSDIDEGNLRIYLKVYSDGEEDEHCTSESTEFSDDDYHEVEFVREDDPAVIVREQDLEGSIVASCGADDVQISFPVYNIGSEKEDGVLVNLYNAELGIDEYVSLGSLSSGKKDQATFLIDIPETASKNSYKLDVFTYFEYDEDEDEMEESSYDSNSFDDLDRNFEITLELLDCSKTSTSKPTVNAILDSPAKVGEELVIRTAITNTGSEPKTYVISTSDVSSWAGTVSISPQAVNLAPGASAEVMIKLNPTKEGLQTFSITSSANGESYSQPVSVNIAAKSGAVSGLGLGEENLKYLVIILAVLIILVIVLIIARVFRSGSRNREERF